MGKGLIAFLLIYLLVALFTMVISLGKVVWQEDEDFILNCTPSMLYDNYRSLNMFACIMLWILILIVNPVWQILVNGGTFLIYNVGKFFKFICTVGRKN